MAINNVDRIFFQIKNLLNNINKLKIFDLSYKFNEHSKLMR